MNDVVFEYRLTGAGFCEALFRVGVEQLDVSLGDQSDPLEELMSAALALAQGEDPSPQIIWDPEDGGLYRWRFARKGDRVRLRVDYVDSGDLRRRGPNADVPARPIDATCPVRAFCSAVANCATQVIAEYGPERYLELWFSPFPFELLDELRASIVPMPE